MTAEFDLIERIAQRVRHLENQQVDLGIGDDAALLDVASDQHLVAALDTMVDGVHFDQQLSGQDIGWKIVAVNLSDLAAMGAQARSLLLALTLPQGDQAWVDAFLDGLSAACEQHQVALVGGDTTSGPLTVSITALGEVPKGAALRRDGAAVGDCLLVTGCIGDAALALRLQAAGQTPTAPLLTALNRPQPQLAAGVALRGIASSCIDISDGLLADLGHIVDASGVGARVDVAQLPLSESFLEFAAGDWQLAVTGGDDYQLCFSVDPSKVSEAQQALAGVNVTSTQIGHCIAGSGVLLNDNGKTVMLGQPGYEHFV